MTFHRNHVSLTARCATHGTPVHPSATVWKLTCPSVNQLELLSATPVTVVCMFESHFFQKYISLFHYNEKGFILLSEKHSCSFIKLIFTKMFLRHLKYMETFEKSCHNSVKDNGNSQISTE